MIVDQLDLVKGGFNIFLVKELFIPLRNATDFDEILKYIVINWFCWVSHVNFAIELCFLHKIRQASAVVNMEVGHKQELDFFWIYDIKIG